MSSGMLSFRAYLFPPTHLDSGGGGILISRSFVSFRFVSFCSRCCRVFFGVDARSDAPGAYGGCRGVAITFGVAERGRRGDKIRVFFVFLRRLCVCSVVCSVPPDLLLYVCMKVLVRSSRVNTLSPFAKHAYSKGAAFVCIFSEIVAEDLERRQRDQKEKKGVFELRSFWGALEFILRSPRCFFFPEASSNMGS